ncbi:MAG: hypothetical protein MJ237_08520 [bacterium]|nr:hypothetical protein [bacterium]
MKIQNITNKNSNNTQFNGRITKSAEKTIRRWAKENMLDTNNALFKKEALNYAWKKGGMDLEIKKSNYYKYTNKRWKKAYATLQENVKNSADEVVLTANDEGLVFYLDGIMNNIHDIELRKPCFRGDKTFLETLPSTDEFINFANVSKFINVSMGDYIVERLWLMKNKLKNTINSNSYLLPTMILPPETMQTKLEKIIKFNKKHLAKSYSIKRAEEDLNAIYIYKRNYFTNQLRFKQQNSINTD